MKGLAEVSPDLQRVKISSRSARKHYGANSSVVYDKKKHGDVATYVKSKAKDPRRIVLTPSYRTYDAFAGVSRVNAMWWYLNKVSVDSVKHLSGKIAKLLPGRPSEGA